MFHNVTAHSEFMGILLVNFPAASFMQLMQHLVTFDSALFSCLIMTTPDLAS